MGRYIWCLVFSIGFVSSVNSQVKPVLDSSKVLKLDSNKVVKHRRFNKPKFYYVGLDLITPIQWLNNNNNYKQISVMSETILKKNIWLTGVLSTERGSFENQKLKYSSNTSSLTLGISQAFFPNNFKYDYDNAFAGLGYGIAYTRTGEAAYTIEDIWGKQTGVIPANSGVAHWIEFSSGFRFHIIPKLQMGWRIQGKALLNPSTFETNIAPVYIANYGSGDRASNFNYQLIMAYRLGQ